ncbi:MAG: glycoside hydrolase [Flavobacteriales bacterium]|nr:glycoside hydrolase [Flavobacteriales bacterium]
MNSSFITHNRISYRLFYLTVLLSGLVFLTACEDDDDEDPPMDSTPQAPLSAFDLLYVNDNVLNVAFTPSLVWEPSTAADNSEVKYSLLLDRAVDLEDDETPATVIDDEITANFFTITQPLLQSTEYEWCVVARDANGNELKSTSIFSFTTGSIDNQPPNPFNLISPADFATDQPLDVQLFWQTATDPEGDAVTYDVYIGLSPNPFTIVSSTQAATNFTNNNLAESTTYYWYVVAKDGKGGYTVSSSEFEFTTIQSSNPIPGTATVIQAEGRPVTGASSTYEGTRGHQVVVLNGVIYDTAGWSLYDDGGGEGNDVYKSTDGINWEVARLNNPEDQNGFEPSEEHAVAVQNGLMYMFEGNRNLIKSSADGVNWVPVEWTGSVPDNTHYLPRNNHQAVSYGGALYLIGGISRGLIMTDVWRSTDGGISWTEIKPNDNSSWIGSNELRVEIHDGAMWLFDGNDGMIGSTNKLWRSTDGVNWEEIGSLPFSAIRGWAVASYKGGLTAISGDFENEIWWSSNGLNWRQVELSNPNSLTWRRDHDAYVFNGDLYVSYGRGNNSGPELRSDIVKIDFTP